MLTNIFVTGSHKNFFIYPKDVSSRKTIGPSSTGQITKNRCLRVRFVFIALGTVASVETDLECNLLIRIRES